MKSASNASYTGGYMNLNMIKSSKNLRDSFKRTISRLYELTSSKLNL